MIGLSAKAQTTIPGGNVSGHWTVSGSPYNIMGDVTIPTHTTLTIDPGVEVIFKAGYTIIVQGQLLAIGTPADSISITTLDTIAGFEGIFFDDEYKYPGNDSSRVEYCKIEYSYNDGDNYKYDVGGVLLFDNWSNAVVSHCLISNCKTLGNGGAILCDSSSSPVITYNTITRNVNNYEWQNAFAYGGGIYCDNLSNPVISYNNISYNTSRGSSDGYGGGIYFNNSSPIITYNTISHNTAIDGWGGGGLYCSNSSNSVIAYNTISYNSGGNEGGGIGCVMTTNTSINHNIIQYNSGSYGAGIYCESTKNTAINNNIISNNTSWNGGGILCETSTISSINNNTISYNAATTDGSGGGIYCNGDTISSISNNIISFNSADEGGSGGGIYFTGGIISTVSYDTISNNSFSDFGYGGGICCSNGSIINSLSNTSITNNSNLGIYGSGGGLYCSGASPTLINVTIANNSAKEGGALYCTVGAKPNLYNCILWGDTAINIGGGGSELFINDNASAPCFYYCDVRGGKACFDLNGNPYIGTYTNDINSNPLFVSPSDSSGSGFNGVIANWSLQSASPCINTGDPSGTYPATDLAGNPRVVGGCIDMGAYEYQGTVGISLVNHYDILLIYPNPANNNIVVENSSFTKGETITVCDIQGQQLLKQPMQQSKTYIDISAFSKGIYFIKVENEKGIAVKKFVKE